MPHIVVEYSASLSDRLNVDAMLAEMHAALGTEDSVDPARIKSRAIPLTTVIVGDGAQNSAMLHIAIKLMPRHGNVAKRIAQTLHAIGQRYADNPAARCAVTAEIVELNPDTYCP